MNITSGTREYILSNGADLVGIAPVSRFKGAPAGHEPLDLLPSAKSVISFGMRLVDSIVDYKEYLQGAALRVPQNTRAAFLVANFYLEMGHFVQDRELNVLAPGWHWNWKSRDTSPCQPRRHRQARSFSFQTILVFSRSGMPPSVQVLESSATITSF